MRRSLKVALGGAAALAVASCAASVVLVKKRRSEQSRVRTRVVVRASDESDEEFEELREAVAGAPGVLSVTEVVKGEPFDVFFVTVREGKAPFVLGSGSPRPFFLH